MTLDISEQHTVFCSVTEQLTLELVNNMTPEEKLKFLGSGSDD